MLFLLAQDKSILNDLTLCKFSIYLLNHHQDLHGHLRHNDDLVNKSKI